RYLVRARCVYPRKKSGELLTAKPTKHVIGPQMRRCGPTEKFQNLITPLMSEVVIDLFEVIQIEQDEGDGAIVATGSSQELFRRGDEEPSIERSCERVDTRRRLVTQF